MPSTYCCSRFDNCVKNGEIMHADDMPDETEWYIPRWYHIYFCPFCGANIKGEGFGKPEQSRDCIKK